MADISKITLPNGASYDFKDAMARSGKQNIRNGTVSGNVDWNTLTTPGTYKIQNTTMTADYNAPVGEYGYGILVVFDSESGGENRIMQIYFPHYIESTTNYMYIRMRNGGKWRNWKSLTSNADTVDGKHASDFAAASHTHTKSQITDFPTIPTYGVATSSALGLVKSGTDITVDSSGNVSVNDDSHNHVISNVDGLQSALDGKADSSHNHSNYALKSIYDVKGINLGGKAEGMWSSAIGFETTASGKCSHAEGSDYLENGTDRISRRSVTISDVVYTIAGSTAYGTNSHAEGTQTFAYGYSSHAEGNGTTASGKCSHAEGHGTTASGVVSHAEGMNTVADGKCSHAGGTGTKALHENEVAYGSYNESYADTLFSIGDGTSDTVRHNAFEITTTGGMLHDKDIFTSAHCIQFIPYNMKYYALNDRLLLFSNDDAVARGIYFVNNTPNDIVVCALISATGSGPTVQYGYGTNTYPDIQNTGEGREWFSEESILTHPTIYTMTVPTGKRGYYGVYRNSETVYTTIHDIRCPYFNYF